jgi:hypothetical protein
MDTVADTTPSVSIPNPFVNGSKTIYVANYGADKNYGFTLKNLNKPYKTQ